MHGSFYKQPSNLRPAVANSENPAASNRGADFRVYNQAVLGQLLADASSFNVNLAVKAAITKLCRQHPMISVDPEMLGGVPHIKGMRLSVGDILAKLYIYGNIDEVTAIFSPDLSKEQVKEAIAFAQDFLEEVSVPT